MATSLTPSPSTAGAGSHIGWVTGVADKTWGFGVVSFTEISKEKQISRILITKLISVSEINVSFSNKMSITCVCWELQNVSEHFPQSNLRTCNSNKYLCSELEELYSLGKKNKKCSPCTLLSTFPDIFCYLVFLLSNVLKFLMQNIYVFICKMFITLWA